MTLKPCPFCGGEAEYKRTAIKTNGAMIQNDLISRSALIDQLERLATHEDAWRQSCILGIVRTIDNAPAVDAVVLPVHVQQIVYADLRLWETTLNVQPFMVTCITVTQNKKGEWTKKFRANWFKDEKAVDVSHDFLFDEIGKTVFLTKEEAETVLGRADDGKL